MVETSDVSSRFARYYVYILFFYKADAKAREEFLKSGYGRKQMKQFLKYTLNDLNAEWSD